MKNQLGHLYKLLAAVFLAFAPLCVIAYETAILHYPDRDWRMVSYVRDTDNQEVIAKFVPVYDDKLNWVEMLVFHSYKANGNAENADNFVSTVMGPNYEKFGNEIKLETIKSEREDALVSWCAEKGTDKDPAQCEILRVTKGVETMIAIQYINRDIKRFPYRKKIWIEVLKNATVYYSYYRWDRMMNKALCVEL